MTLRPATAVGAVALVAIGLSAAPAGAAAPATVTGKLGSGSVKLPKSPRKGQAQVIATNVDTSAFGAAAQVGKSGRYTLKLPAGKWALRSSVVARDKPFASFPSARIVTRAGKRRKLPLTLKRFKKPRRRARAHRTNINPRDGRFYPGEFFGVERFNVSGGADIGPLGRGVADMLITDLMTKPKCEFTLVEVINRNAVLSEQALQQSEYVDPASRVEPGHLIDPEILIRGRVEDRPGTPRRLALIAWLVDAKTGAKISGDVSSVTLHADFFKSEERLVELIQRDLICARAVPKPPPAPTSAPAASPPVCSVRSSCPPPPSPPGPPAAPDRYSGTFSGEADSEAGYLHWTWSGSVVMDAAQDEPHFPPNGAPEGTYRVFTVTSGGVDISVMANPPGCVFTGSGHFDLEPGLLNTLTVQLDDASPAYALNINGSIVDTLPTVQSGPECPGIPTSFGLFQIWASTGTTAHTSPALTLVDSQAELTPETPADYDYTTRWNLSPG